VSLAFFFRPDVTERSLLLFRRTAEPRNFSVFATWAMLLFLAGILWSLPAAWVVACLGLAALVDIVLAFRFDCRSLGFHGVVYLAFAGIAAGLPGFAFHALAGPMPAKPAWCVFLVSAFAALCYVAGKERIGEDWQQQLLHFVPAFLAVCGVTALMAQGLLRLASLFVTPGVFHLAFIRTLTVCSVALALAFFGARWQRLEIARIAYTALAFEAAKLLFEDLRSGRVDFIAASFFLFAVALIGVPRLAHPRRGA